MKLVDANVPLDAVNIDAPPGVREAIRPGEAVVGGTGHAEANIVAWAEANGYRVISVGAGRSHCPSCVDVITGAGVITATPRRGP